MTRKDFKMVATVVAAIDDQKTRNEVALNFVSELHKLNERFDAVRFLSACKASHENEAVDRKRADDDFHAAKEKFVAP